MTISEGNPTRILVVDDEPAITRLVAQRLAGKGYACATCVSAAKAIGAQVSGARAPA